MVARASAEAEQLRGELERMKGSLTREAAMRAEAERQVPFALPAYSCPHVTAQCTRIPLSITAGHGQR